MSLAVGGEGEITARPFLAVESILPGEECNYCTSAWQSLKSSEQSRCLVRKQAETKANGLDRCGFGGGSVHVRHDSSYPEMEPTPCQVFPGPPDVEVEGVPVFLDPPSRHRIPRHSAHSA